ncbi:MAG: hypothetical protein AAGA20_08680 [Planctomycetota bacterium]
MILRRASVCATVLIVLACSSTEPSRPPAQALEMRGDPATVAEATEILEERAARLRDIDHVRALCIRHETVAASGRSFVSEGPLTVRREPPTILFRPGGRDARQVLESPKARLVVDPANSRASRWSYDTNGRALAGVASILLDLDILASAFTVEAVDVVRSEVDPNDPFAVESETLQRVTLRSDANAAIPGIARLELFFAPRQDIPRRIDTISSDGGRTRFELLRPTLDPEWRDVDAHFQLEVPPGFTVSEER